MDNIDLIKAKARLEASFRFNSLVNLNEVEALYNEFSEILSKNDLLQVYVDKKYCEYRSVIKNNFIAPVFISYIDTMAEIHGVSLKSEYYNIDLFEKLTKLICYNSSDK